MENRKKVLALGFFDGVHRGHGALLRCVARRAKEYGAVPAAITFDPHPSALLEGETEKLINTVADRAWLMGHYYGIEDVAVTPFDQHLMHQPWEEFVTDFLIGEHHVAHVVCGHDFHFGYRGQGNPQRLKELCARLGVGCDIIAKVEQDGITISSTYIRGLIARGEVEEAERFLGHPHCLSGTVVHGKQLGRTIGIPTSNLLMPPEVLPPAYGVYATRVTLEDGRRYMAVTNVGVRPTLDDGDHVTVEPWILDFDGDLYGQTIRVEFFRHLRGERRFDGLASLQAEIFRNGEQTRAYFREKGTVL